MIRAHAYRLYPTPAQEGRLSQWVGAVRATYNVALEQRRTFWRPGRKFNFVTQGRELTALRSAVDWINDVPRVCLDQALRDLDQAYANWWAGRSGPPGFRKRGQNDSFRLRAVDTRLARTSKNTGFLNIPKMGAVRVRWDGPLIGELRNVTVIRRGGAWQRVIKPHPPRRRESHDAALSHVRVARGHPPDRHRFCPHADAAKLHLGLAGVRAHCAADGRLSLGAQNITGADLMDEQGLNVARAARPGTLHHRLRAAWQAFKLDGQQKAEIAARYGAGEKVDAIALGYGVANGSVIHLGRSAGHPPRRPARPRHGA